MTPTAGHQFDLPPVPDSVRVEGLAADGDVLRLVEGHLAPHRAGLARGDDANVGLDAQHIRLGLQQLPQVRLVAAPCRDQMSGMRSRSFVEQPAAVHLLARSAP